MGDFPRSVLEFQRRFPDDAACAAYLADARWPEGFICPACGHGKAWQLDTKPWTYECAACHRQTSVRAGTVMHGSKLSLTVWFWAAYLMATHSNGMSARQLWRQLGLGSYKSAWLLCAKLRRAMVDPERALLTGIVEVDETALSYRAKDDPPAGGHGRSRDGKLPLAGADESVGNGPGRSRLAVIEDYSATSLHAFIRANIAEGATARTDGWPAYPGAPGVDHDPHVVGTMAAHVLLPWVHRVFANLKTWALGVYHGLRRPHLQSYLDEFVFRFNRRRTPQAAFRTLLGIGIRIKPATYNMLIAPGATG
ncbi:MAG: IS1595 family transposase [Methyloceanibacter sp.]|uniref:IS1595 family transposase n=1 Tax=Methyloceanibacter sp. TaxID=1965321 RepID=UPI003EE16B45